MVLDQRYEIAPPQEHGQQDRHAKAPPELCMAHFWAPPPPVPLLMRLLRLLVLQR